MSGTKNENRGGKRLTKLVLFESLRSVLKSGVTGKSSKSQNVLVAAKLGEPLSLPCVFGNQLPVGGGQVINRSAGNSITFKGEKTVIRCFVEKPI